MPLSKKGNVKVFLFLTSTYKTTVGEELQAFLTLPPARGKKVAQLKTPSDRRYITTV
jgi:hypothetical protein